MNSFDIRKKFFAYFEHLHHTKVTSSSLIPAQDKTLLFANAGMNQFKDIFLGAEERSYTRAVSIQKCMRAGGKHNDLENVGFTKRHLTFFEMMGNFSFGNYFKKEAIRYAWDFLTKEVGIDPKRLLATVYVHDDEAYNLWRTEIGLPEERVSRLGEADNFWQMGDTGPCGPCSEIYYDTGNTLECGSKDCSPGCSCDRFLEIWNLVFMQFDRQPDGTDKPLKKKGVDTGMGLERLCAVLQQKDSVFDTDLFAPLITRTEELTGIRYNEATPELKAAFRVIADHIRSSSFAIADGGMPSNEGRGYVIRKIIRRAALFTQKLSSTNFFPDLAPALIEQMGDLYPELKQREKVIVTTLRSEVEKFNTTFIHGQSILEKYFQEQALDKRITGFQAFKLYDTYGFPLELTKVIAQERGFSVDTDLFEKYMEEQRALSGKKQAQEECPIEGATATAFTGYEEHKTIATVQHLIVGTEQVNAVDAHTDVFVITDKSPFYVECGGQVSDQGFIIKGAQEAPLRGLKKIGPSIAAFVQAPFPLSVGDQLVLQVDSPARMSTMRNHTATHLLQAALLEIIGPHIKQAGSVVAPGYMRFDFTIQENLTPEQITLVENLVNKKILENIPVSVTHTTLKEATNRGVIAFFGEKYNPETVRVIEVPGFSAELCGGTHVSATGDIGCFKITELSALAAGVKRIVAVTGTGALELFQKTFSLAKTLGQEYKVLIEEVHDAITKQKTQLKTAQTTIKTLKKQFYLLQMPHWLENIQNYGPVPFLYLVIPDATLEDLREIAQEFMKAQPGLYFLAASSQDRPVYYVALHQNLITHIDLKQLGAWLKEQGLQGGGTATSLQGTAPKLDIDLEYSLKQWIQSHVK